MKRVLIFTTLALIVLSLIVLIVSCGQESKPTPIQTSEPEIPNNFTTYTEEGLFSISYPFDWQPASAVMEEIWEETRAMMESEDPEISLEQVAMLFFAGKETLEGYYPSVGILTDIRSTGYWTVDEVFEASSRYERENTIGYKELSVSKIKVDGRDTIIVDIEDNEPGYGRWRYIQTFAVKGDFAWLVTCSCEYQDFSEYEDTFHSIVRSFKILN